MRKYGVFLGILLSGCALEGTETESDAEPAVSASLALSEGAEVLADVQLPEGRRIHFVETTPGAVTFSEIGPGAHEDALLPRLQHGKLLEVYDALAEHGAVREEAVAERLAQAQERVDALRAQVEARGVSDRDTLVLPGEPLPQVEASVGLEVGKGEAIGVQRQAVVWNTVGPHPLYSGPVFAGLYCTPEELGMHDELCLLNRTGNVDTGFSGDLSRIRSIVLNTAASGNLTHRLRQFVCTVSAAGICITRDWRTVITQTVPPGFSGHFVDDFKWTRFTASGTAYHFSAVWRYR
jgi:hypothetical protein